MKKKKTLLLLVCCIGLFTQACGMELPKIPGNSPSNTPTPGKTRTLTSTEKQALEAAGVSSEAIEYVLTGSSLVRSTSPQSPDSGDTKSTILNTAVDGVKSLLKKCFEGAGLATEKNRFKMSFSKEGCQLPLTSIRFRGDVDVQYYPNKNKQQLEMTFQNFAIFQFAVDGKVLLTIEKDKTHYDFEKLNVEYGDFQIVLDGKGTFENDATLSTVTFSGTGDITYNGMTYGFEAKQIKRRLRTDCYPVSGTLTIRLTKESLGKSLEVKIDYNKNSGSLGKVTTTIAGHSFEKMLPKRTACLQSK